MYFRWWSSDYVIGTWRRTFGATRSRISDRLSPVHVRPWFRRPITACAGSGSSATRSATAIGELLRPARVVHVRRRDALHPRVHVQDRADVGVRLVDHPVLDRVHRHVPRLDSGRDAEHDHSALLVEVLDHEGRRDRRSRASTCRLPTRSSKRSRPSSPTGFRTKARPPNRGA